MITGACPFEIPPEIKVSALYASGGFVVFRGLLADESFRELVAEALTARAGGKRNVLAASDRTEERGGSPCRAFTSAPGGVVQWRLFSAPALLASLAQICGLSAQPTGGGSYTYYEEAGDFLALHRDIVTCDLAVITCLQETAPEHCGGGLLVYPRHMSEPLLSVRAAGRATAIPAVLRRGDTIALLGGIVPHEVIPMEQRRQRIVSVMCYRVLPAGWVSSYSRRSRMTGG